MNKGKVLEIIKSLPDANSLPELLSKLQIKLIYDEYSTRDGYSYMGKIALKKDLSYEHRIFVICHEIGHVLMHNSTSLLTFSDSNTDRENEANLFALLLINKLDIDICSLTYSSYSFLN